VTPQERFKAICSFERPNDPFMWSVDSWNETFERWVREGMPVKNLDNKKELNEYLIGCQDQNEAIVPKGAIGGMSKNNNPPWCVAIDPVFKTDVMHEDDEFIVQRDYDGAIVRRRKNDDDTIPQYLEYPVKDKKSWDEFKKRLDPFSPGRWPAGWEIMTDDKMQFPLKPEHAGRHHRHRDFPLGMNLLSLYGNPRNYMGVEAISMAIYDNPSLVEEMVEWQSHLALEMLKKVFAAGVTLEWVWIWEDMCFNKGPLVSPEWVKRVMVPRYRPVVDLLRANKVDALILDCDGKIDELESIWVDCGINGTYPLECAAGMDARNVRKKFGKNLIIFGNVDKRALAQGRAAIDGELAKVRELLKTGGYFPNADHHIPPDVPYGNIRYFMNELRKMSDYPEARRSI
jgi:uroporphyrinogen decarboxylase